MFSSDMTKDLWGFVRDGLVMSMREEAEQQRNPNIAFGPELGELSLQLHVPVNNLIDVTRRFIDDGCKTPSLHPLFEYPPRIIGTWMQLDNFLHSIVRQGSPVPNFWLSRASLLAQAMHRSIEQSEDDYV